MDSQQQPKNPPKRRNSDGGTLFDGPYKAPIKIQLRGNYERPQLLGFLQELRTRNDPDALRNVLSVCCIDLSDDAARELADLMIEWLQPNN